MKKILSAVLILCLLLLSPVAYALGGSQQLAYTSGYSFIDSVGHNFYQNFNWQSAQIVDPSRIAAQGNSSPSRYPNSTLHITVDPGDQPIPGCMTCHERNENYGMFFPLGTDESTSSGTVYYGFSSHLPSTFTTDLGAGTGGFFWNIPFQLHGPDSGPCASASPVFSMSFASGVPPNGTEGGVPNTHLILIVEGGECTAPTVNVVDLGLRSLAYNQFVDFVFQVHWATDSSGFVNVWTRTNPNVAYKQTQLDGVTPIPQQNGPNLYTSSGTPVTYYYWKHGIYRNGGPNPIDYYSGPFIRAPNFHDAVLGSTGSYP